MSTNKGVPASHNKPPSPGGAKYDSPGQSESASDALGTDTPRTLLPLLPRREERAGERRASMREVHGGAPRKTAPSSIVPLEEREQASFAFNEEYCPAPRAVQSKNKSFDFSAFSPAFS